MRRSFYHYLMTQRSPQRDALSNFANDVFTDSSFPKHTSDYETLSHYLEFSVDYLSSMDIFDQAYQQYLDNNQ
ncbi:YozE family protein [Enterococcus nangangensis]|uniref:YozE family protein n=1 Tax=Enterococcus nangangensis TaxID=2559926 RepID=UPI0010F5DE09|nr:YozE family protein [Enterococcus nangangensis]